MIPPDFIQTLLSRVDIVDVIEQYVPLKKAGANYAACCPFHQEKTPSFTVSPTKQFYHCFGCGAHGSAIGFMMNYGGSEFVDAVKQLAERVGMQVPEIARPVRGSGAAGSSEIEPAEISAALRAAMDYYRAQLKNSQRAIEYLKKRGLDGKICARFGIGYAPDAWQNLNAVFPDYAAKLLKEAGLVIDSDSGRRYDRFRDRIMFPIFNQKGEVIGFGGRVIDAGDPKYLNSPETPVFEKGRELYGLTHARRAIHEAGKVVVVEGYMDVVALAQSGIDYAVATLGTATTPNHVQKLVRHAPQIVYCFDGDAAGHRAAWRALETSLPFVQDGRAISFLFLPAEHDPDSYIRAHGREGFEQALAKATPLSSYLVDGLLQEHNLKSDEGRAALLQAAKPLLQQIAAPMQSLMLRKRLAELTGLARTELDRLVGGAPTAPAAASPAPVRASRKAPSLAARVASLALARPDTAKSVTLPIMSQADRDQQLLGSILLFLRSAGAGAVNLGALYEGLNAAGLGAGFNERMQEAERLLASLPPEDLDRELTDGVTKLFQEQRNEQIQLLSRKAQAQGLSQEEKHAYQQLIAARP
jgi:DNA primase